MLGTDKRNVANEVAAPGAIDLGAEFALDGLEVALPGLAVGRHFQVTGFAADGASVGCKSFADDFGPGCGEPRDSGFGPLQAAESGTEKAAYSFHEGADVSTARLRRKRFLRFARKVKQQTANSLWAEAVAWNHAQNEAEERKKHEIVGGDEAARLRGKIFREEPPTSAGSDQKEDALAEDQPKREAERDQKDAFRLAQGDERGSRIHWTAGRIHESVEVRLLLL
jgi:hypothetical protein